MLDPSGPEILVDRILDAFASQHEEAYFSCFDARATFVYHYRPEQMSLQQYRRLWRTWAETGLEVVACTSTDRSTHLFGDLAIFLHSVETVTRLEGVVHTVSERETIVLADRGGEWKAIHQHLSLSPDMELK